MVLLFNISLLSNYFKNCIKSWLHYFLSFLSSKCRLQKNYIDKKQAIQQKVSETKVYYLCLLIHKLKKQTVIIETKLKTINFWDVKLHLCCLGRMSKHLESVEYTCNYPHV